MYAHAENELVQNIIPLWGVVGDWIGTGIFKSGKIYYFSYGENEQTKLIGN